MSIESVLRKVQALRDLAARAGTIHEAQAAAAQADALLHKHRLSEAELQASGRVAPEAIVDDETPVFIAGQRMESWRTRIAATVADHYGCVAYTRRPAIAPVTIHIVGRPSDLQIARYMFSWLSAEVERLALKEPGAARHLFKHGAVTGIGNVLDAQRKRTEAEHAKANGGVAGIVLASRVEEVVTWLRTANPNMGNARKATLSGTKSDYDRGIEAGEAIHLGAALPSAVRALPGASS